MWIVFMISALTLKEAVEFAPFKLEENLKEYEYGYRRLFFWTDRKKLKAKKTQNSRKKLKTQA